MSKTTISGVLILLLVLTACGSNTDTDPTPPLDPNTGISYFFLVEGKYREYEVNEIRYRAVGISDTFAYQIREEVREPLGDVQPGEAAHLLYRFRRTLETDPWQLDSIWTAKVDSVSQRAISIENNIPVVKAIFPAVEERTWDGNAFNTNAQDDFVLSSFEQPFQSSLGTFFLRSMVVDQNDEDDLLTFRDQRREVYADSIGLVLRDYFVIKYCSRSECVGQEQIESGRFYRETLIAHGSVDDE